VTTQQTARAELDRLLPYRVRLRLKVIRRVDKLCFRLADSGHWQMAVLIWRACGLW